jgi:tellurite resistance protein TerC
MIFSTPEMWIGFFVFIGMILAMEAWMLKSKQDMIAFYPALFHTLFLIACAVLFGLGLLLFDSKQHALEFFAGYAIEGSLSVDNMFVFLMIFQYFRVPVSSQRRVLVYGVLGAIVLRFIMIAGGTWLVNSFHWVLYLFGLFLIGSGIMILFSAERKKDLERHIILRGLRKCLRLTDEYHGKNFFIKRNALWYATPLFIVLVLIEFSDVVFALDSIPAIFAVTNDIFIIFTSNIFAILGLRALYFVLENMAERFYLLKYGVAILLTFVGSKMLTAHWFKMPIALVLTVIIGVLGTTIILSLITQRRKIGKA